ncbi:hypothetical protein CTI12_AA594590 [Artemisia annua]|uniref:DUF8039 domain-containing protein n=1 Tax=Artemisia annua TaxID=35608 RepID=A0A2U1KJR0_ARTAN|nr:hypothetical protein CTI12_AA594590 [Artemisia annua]
MTTVEDFDGLKDEITKPLREKIKPKEADLEILQATLKKGGSFKGLLQGTSSSGGSFDRFDGIETPTPCELLVPYGDIEETMANAMLYPRRDGKLDGIQMRPGYSKVQVDTVEEAYTNSFVVVPTDAVGGLCESFGHFIQWP